MKRIIPWTQAVNMCLRNLSNNTATHLIRKKQNSNTKTKRAQLHKHWEGNSWSAEIKGAWESTSPSLSFSSPRAVPTASQGLLLRPWADDLVPAKIGALLISARGMLWACSWQILIVQDLLGWKRSLSWARSLMFLALHHCRRDFISLNQLLLGSSRRSTQIISSLACVHPQLFSREPCWKLWPLFCSWKLLGEGVVLELPHFTVCFSLSLSGWDTYLVCMWV